MEWYTERHFCCLCKCHPNHERFICDAEAVSMRYGFKICDPCARTMGLITVAQAKYELIRILYSRSL